MRRKLIFLALLCLASSYAYAGCNTTGTTTSCTNNNPITIPATSFNGALESSAQTVSGITGSIQTITISINDWTDNGTNNGPGTEDREMMLVFQPSGGGAAQTFQFLGGLGLTGTTTFNNENITFEDSATLYAPDEDAYAGAPTGDKPPTNPATYKPSVNKANNYCSGNSTDGSAAFNGAPFTSAPCATDNPADPQYESSGGTATFSSQFSGSPNGTWTLYVWTNKDAEDDGATIGGWTLNITIQANAANTTTTMSSNTTPLSNEAFEGSSVTLTATVRSTSTPSEGTVRFTDNGADLSCAGGNPVPISGGSATCSTSFSTEGSHSLAAQYTGDANFGNSSGNLNFFVDHTTSTTGTAGQYCNTGTISINTNTSPGTTPYPQHIFVPSQSGALSDVSLYLPNITIDQMMFFNFLLVDPNGNKFVPMAGTGGDGNASGVMLTLSDYAAGQNPVPNPTGGTNDAPASGQYLPTDYNSGLSFASTSYPQTPPAGPYQLPQTQGGATFDTTFGGSNAQGMWSLYAYYTSGESTGSIGGYCLTITTSAAVATTTTVTSSPMTEAPTNTSVTFNATVKQSSNSSPVTSGSVAFKEGTTALSCTDGPNPRSVSGGAASCQVSSLAEGIHNIEALYNGVAGTYNVSSNSVAIEIDTPTTNPSTGVYCNPGGVNISSSNGGNNISANPYPSRLNVSNLAGTVNTVGVQLNNYSDGEPYGTVMLLQGPTSTNIVFYNDAGSESTGFTGLNLTLADSGSSQLPADPTNPTTNITYAAASYTGLPTPVFPAPGPSGLSFAKPEGSQTFTNAFQNINGNGYWSLYLYDRFGDEGVSINNWCLNFVENPPVVTLSKTHNGAFTQGDTADTYTITVANPSGPGSTGGTMTLTDTLPTGMSAVSMSETANTGGGTGSDWICTVGTVSCTRTSPMGPGESDTITLKVSVSYNTPTATNGAVNNVSLTGGGISGAPVTAQDTQTVQAGPGYELDLSVSPPGSGTAGANPTNSAGLTAGHYVPGATVTIGATSTQTATIGYAFSSWTGSPDISNASAGTTTITMNSAIENVTANFVVAYQQVSGVSVSQTGWTYNRFSKQGTATVTVKNTSAQTLSGPIQIVLSGLRAGVTAVNNTGTFNGNPFWTVTAGSLAPGASAQISVTLGYANGTNFTANYSVYSGTL